MLEYILHVYTWVHLGNIFRQLPEEYLLTQKSIVLSHQDPSQHHQLYWSLLQCWCLYIPQHWRMLNMRRKKSCFDHQQEVTLWMLLCMLHNFECLSDNPWKNIFNFQTHLGSADNRRLSKINNFQLFPVTSSEILCEYVIVNRD